MKLAAEVVHIHLEATFFSQRIVKCCPAAQSDLTLVFGISRSENHGFFRMIGLDEKRNQLGGAISYNNVFGLRVSIGSDDSPESLVFPVRVSGDGVQLGTERISELGGDAKWVYICGKTDDIFLFDTVNLFYLF